jgi:hypothetical protein
MTDDAERHRRNRRRKNNACGVRNALRERDRPEAGKPGEQQRGAVVTSTAAAAITSRFALVASTSAPAGVCATIPAIVAIDITIPICASSHFCSVSR